MQTLTQDTTNLLKECSAGVRMAVASIDGVMDYVMNDTLKHFLSDSKTKHEAIGRDIDKLLNQTGEEGKEPPTMAKMMSWIKINYGLTKSPTDKEAASLVYDGCNMGIKTLYEYLNTYTTADATSKELAHKLITEEEKLISCLRNFV